MMKKPEFAMQGLEGGQLNAGVKILGGKDGFLQLLRGEVLVVHGRDEYKPMPGMGLGVAEAALEILLMEQTVGNTTIAKTPRDLGFAEKGYIGGGVPRGELYKEAYQQGLGFCSVQEVLDRVVRGVVNGNGVLLQGPPSPPANEPVKYPNWVYVAMPAFEGSDGYHRVIGISQDTNRPYQAPCLSATYTLGASDLFQLDDTILFHVLSEEEKSSGSNGIAKFVTIMEQSGN